MPSIILKDLQLKITNLRRTQKVLNLNYLAKSKIYNLLHQIQLNQSKLIQSLLILSNYKVISRTRTLCSKFIS